MNATNNGSHGFGIFSLSRLVFQSNATLRSESNADLGLLVSSIAIATCTTETTVILLNNVMGPSFVSDNSQVSQACLGPVTTSQASIRRSAVPEPTFDEKEN